MSNPRINTMLLAIASLAIMTFLAAAIFGGGSAGGTLASGRSVMAHSDSISLSSTLSGDTATIETAGIKILVQPTSLVVDGMIVADIDKDVADVQVHVNRGVVSFVADGRPVETSLR